VSCTVTVTNDGDVPLKQLAVTSGSDTVTCVATTLAAAASTTCTFTHQLSAGEIAAGTSTFAITAEAAPDVTSTATIDVVTAADSLTQTRTAQLKLEHASPAATVTALGEWLQEGSSVASVPDPSLSYATMLTVGRMQQQQQQQQHSDSMEC
jgi:hypothetical protein